MAQISRPFQIALVAVGLLACVWFVALRGHSSSNSSSGSAASEPAPAPSSAPQHSATAPSAPGVSGLAKDVEKARGAVSTSQQNAAQLAQKSAQASSPGTPSAPSATTAAPSPKAAAPTTAPAPKTATPTTHASAPKPAHPLVKPKAATPHAAVTASRQHAVEAQLKSGDVVLLLFWNRTGTDDKAVQKQVRQVAGDGKIAVQEATAKEVAAFGTITRGVQLFTTPTVLVLNHLGSARVVTGLTDAYALRQLVADARHS